MWNSAIDVTGQFFSCTRENEKNTRLLAAYTSGKPCKGYISLINAPGDIFAKGEGAAETELEKHRPYWNSDFFTVPLEITGPR